MDGWFGQRVCFPPHIVNVYIHGECRFQRCFLSFSQVTASSMVHVPINNLHTIGGTNNTVTIGNNALPVMLVRMAPGTNQVQHIPMQTVNQTSNQQVQLVPIGRPIGQTNQIGKERINVSYNQLLNHKVQRIPVQLIGQSDQN